VAAVNSPVNVVLSGDQQAMHVVQDYKNHGEVFCKRLGELPGHSTVSTWIASKNISWKELIAWNFVRA
jgi:hypothetical protein